MKNLLTKKEKKHIYYEKNKEREHIRNATYYSRNKEKCLQYQKNIDKKLVLLRAKKSRLKIQYGITLEDYNKMYNKQEGKCAICKIPNEELKKDLFVDHDHVTGKFRGLLCMHCNHGVGKFKDNIEIVRNLLNYLIDSCT